MYPADGLADVLIRSWVTVQVFRTTRSAGCARDDGSRPLAESSDLESGAIGLGSPASEILNEEPTQLAYYSVARLTVELPVPVIRILLGTHNGNLPQKRSWKWILFTFWCLCWAARRSFL